MNPMQNVQSSHNFDFSTKLKEDISFFSALKTDDKIAISENGELSISGSSFSGYLNYVPFLGKTLLNKVVVPLSRSKGGDTIFTTIKYLSDLLGRIEEEKLKLNFAENIDRETVHDRIKEEGKLCNAQVKLLTEGLDHLSDTYKNRISKDQLPDVNLLNIACVNVEAAVIRFYRKKIEILNSKKENFSVSLINKPSYMCEVPHLWCEEDSESAISDMKLENEILRFRNQQLDSKIMVKFDKFSQWLFIPNGKIENATVVQNKEEDLQEMMKRHEMALPENKEEEALDSFVNVDLSDDESVKFGDLYQLNKKLRHDNEELRHAKPKAKPTDFSDMFEEAMNVFSLLEKK